MSDVPAPRANPPIGIGPFSNVPAPGSPIRSDWCQSISQYVTDVLWDSTMRHMRYMSGVFTTDAFGNIAIPISPALPSFGGAVITESTPEGVASGIVVKILTAGGSPGNVFSVKIIRVVDNGGFANAAGIGLHINVWSYN